MLLLIKYSDYNSMINALVQTSYCEITYVVDEKLYLALREQGVNVDMAYVKGSHIYMSNGKKYNNDILITDYSILDKYLLQLDRNCCVEDFIRNNKSIITIEEFIENEEE